MTGDENLPLAGRAFASLPSENPTGAAFASDADGESDRSEVTPVHPTSPQRKLRLDASLSVHKACQSAFRSVCAYAREVSFKASDDATLAVLEYRKSMRRLRALTKLVRPAMDDGAYRYINGALRLSARRLSSLRDFRILLLTLQRLPRKKKTYPAREMLTRALEEKVSFWDARGQSLELLTECADAVDSMPELFSRAFCEQISVESLEQQIHRTVAGCQRLLHKSLRHRKAQTAHDLRKQCKTLRYQLEIFLDLGDKHSSKLQKRVGQLARELGKVTDLIVLRDFLRNLKRDQNAGVRRVAGFKALCRQTEALYETRLQEVLILHGRTLLAPPATFTQGLCDTRSTQDADTAPSWLKNGGDAS